ncbi:MAG TPA: DPP IV N-terminal domain-containing protein, partial [Gemmatimonadota bacterium]|nr:DPP IV N-terminal domain-containing protein [Gemmatimonadota bacterium]
MTYRTVTFLVALALAAPAAAQVPQLSVQTIFASSDFDSELVSVNWLDDGQSYATLDSNGRVVDLYRVDARSGERQLLLAGADLIPQGRDEPVRIGRYDFSADGSKLLIATDEERIWRRSTRARYYVWDFDARTLTPVSAAPGMQQYAKFSPDAQQVAFVRDNDIYVTDLASGDETALTSDGSEDIINGTTDWVYEEELSLADGFRWSPDG